MNKTKSRTFKAKHWKTILNPNLTESEEVKSAWMKSHQICINESSSLKSVCLFDRLVIDYHSSSEDERVKGAADPDLSSPNPAPAATTSKACPALNVSYVYMYCVTVCVNGQPAALCALTFIAAVEWTNK